MKMCNCKHALGYEDETGCAVCGHDGCEYNDTIEQLTSRVKELESERVMNPGVEFEYKHRIFTLEQQLKDMEELNAENSRRCINNANEILRQGEIC